MYYWKVIFLVYGLYITWTLIILYISNILHNYQQIVERGKIVNFFWITINIRIYGNNEAHMAAISALQFEAAKFKIPLYFLKWERQPYCIFCDCPPLYNIFFWSARIHFRSGTCYSFFFKNQNMMYMCDLYNKPKGFSCLNGFFWSKFVQIAFLQKLQKHIYIRWKIRMGNTSYMKDSKDNRIYSTIP